MKLTKRFFLVALCIASFPLPAFAADPLPSWNDTASKKAIVAFVEKVTKPGSPVSLDYFDRAPFKFDGKIEKVAVKLQ